MLPSWIQRPSGGREVALTAILALGGCGEEAKLVPLHDPPPPDVAVAPGAILSVDGLALEAAELEPLIQDLALLYPENARVHNRRLALTNVFLPRLAARAAAGEAWAAARAACERAGEGLAGGLDELDAWRGEGPFHRLSLGLWSAARHLEPGIWSAPLELPGRWVRVRLDERVEAEDPRREVLRVSVLTFPYLEPAPDSDPVEEAIDRAQLTLVDPEWAEAVPEQWKHRMRGSKP